MSCHLLESNKSITLVIFWGRDDEMRIENQLMEPHSLGMPSVLSLDARRVQRILIKHGDKNKSSGAHQEQQDLFRLQDTFCTI